MSFSATETSASVNLLKLTHIFFNSKKKQIDETLKNFIECVEQMLVSGRGQWAWSVRADTVRSKTSDISGVDPVCVVGRFVNSAAAWRLFSREHPQFYHVFNKRVSSLEDGANDTKVSLWSLFPEFRVFEFDCVVSF